jgi:GH15 family glucan-1,4-alpha-glucosidase
VRIGNDASGQLQLDAYGELVNLTWRWHRRGHSPGDDEWRFLLSLIHRAAEQCNEPDSGIWEWSGEPDHFVHSKVLCWSALDRGIRLADECLRRAPTRRWKQVRDRLRRAIERRGYDRKRGVFVQAFDRPELDAALLLLPTIEFVDWRDERMIRTTQAVREELAAGDGLLYRYRRDDGLPGQEGAFLCCSFWLVECLARQGELDDARAVFDRAISTANDLGLFSEELDPETGELLGNFPQALTHLAHIDAAVALADVQHEL